MSKVLIAPAKLNLFLSVNKKNDDGYHDLSMVMQTISLYDRIEVSIIKQKESLPYEINLACNAAYIPTDNRNLIYRCVDYIYSTYNIHDKISIKLKKIIPTGGGLGGGSSDCASMLIYLNQYYKLKLSKQELINIALRFGSDVPFFIYKKECLCFGRGEIITELKPFKGYFYVIATPNCNMSTKDIYTRYDELIPLGNENQKKVMLDNVINAIKLKNIDALSSNLYNDLERVSSNIVPEVNIFKKLMIKYGAKATLMSGSGPTVFGIFPSYFSAFSCKGRIKKVYKTAFVFLAKPN